MWVCGDCGEVLVPCVPGWLLFSLSIKEARGGEVLLPELPWSHRRRMLAFSIFHSFTLYVVNQADSVISRSQSKAETPSSLSITWGWPFLAILS